MNHPDYQRTLAEVNSYKARLANELSTATRGVGATAGAARQRYNELSTAFAKQKASVLALKQQREEASLLARDGQCPAYLRCRPAALWPESYGGSIHADRHRRAEPGRTPT
ncbi:hypothetical protein [Thiobacillus sp.]|uniref:hypothetical protein n=1 Tax=Thiobacillus sp. TaxID=924 RepID=UPI0025FEAB0F|nr:hypothetical protein [Thiobacillus sp.]